MTDFDLGALYDDTKSLSEGALTIPGYSMDGWYGRIYRGCGFFDADKPIAKFTKRELDALLYKGPPDQDRRDQRHHEGLIPRFRRRCWPRTSTRCNRTSGPSSNARSCSTCPDCGGTRLNGELVPPRSKASTSPMRVPCRSATWRDGSRAWTMLRSLRCWPAFGTLDSFVEIGLGYLSLERPAGTLSGRGGTTHQNDPSSRIVAD